MKKLNSPSVIRFPITSEPPIHRIIPVPTLPMVMMIGQ